MTPANTKSSGSSSGTAEVTEELSNDASRLGNAASERAKQEAETRKKQTTQTAHSTASALDRAAEELERDENAPSWLSSAFRQAASGIDRLAGSVEGRSTDQLAGDVSRYARQNPTTFLAASAAAGFAAARFFRAGADYKQDHRFDGPSGSTDRVGSTGASVGAATSPGYGSAGATYGVAPVSTTAGSTAGTGATATRTSEAIANPGAGTVNNRGGTTR